MATHETRITQTAGNIQQKYFNNTSIPLFSLLTSCILSSVLSFSPSFPLSFFLYLFFTLLPVILLSLLLFRLHFLLPSSGHAVSCSSPLDGDVPQPAVLRRRRRSQQHGGQLSSSSAAQGPPGPRLLQVNQTSVDLQLTFS